VNLKSGMISKEMHHVMETPMKLKLYWKIVEVDALMEEYVP
jgi:hypothetical protein